MTTIETPTSASTAPQSVKFPVATSARTAILTSTEMDMFSQILRKARLARSTTGAIVRRSSVNRVRSAASTATAAPAFKKICQCVEMSDSVGGEGYWGVDGRKH